MCVCLCVCVCVVCVCIATTHSSFIIHTDIWNIIRLNRSFVGVLCTCLNTSENDTSDKAQAQSRSILANLENLTDEKKKWISKVTDTRRRLKALVSQRERGGESAREREREKTRARGRATATSTARTREKEKKTRETERERERETERQRESKRESERERASVSASASARENPCSKETISIVSYVQQLLSFEVVAS